MRVVKVKNYEEMSKRAFETLSKEAEKKPSLCIGLATGRTQLGFYKNLVKSKIDFSKVTTFNLDEYYPIKKENKKSMYYYMHRNFFDKVNIMKKNIHLLNGNTRDVKRECLNYEHKLKKNKIDLQFLGLGEDGHIAYNEPGSTFNSKTRLVELNPITVRDKKTPTKEALTMGISTILKAKKIVLLASGKSKAKAVKCMIKDKISSDCPASFLRKHKDVMVLLDKEAGKLL